MVARVVIQPVAGSQSTVDNVCMCGGIYIYIYICVCVCVCPSMCDSLCISSCARVHESECVSVCYLL